MMKTTPVSSRALWRRYGRATSGRVTLSKLWAWGPKLESALRDVREGRKSFSPDEPVRVSRLDAPRGHFFVMDGHHRAIEAVLRGDLDIATVVDEHVPRIERTGGAFAYKLAAKRRVVDFLAEGES